MKSKMKTHRAAAKRYKVTAGGKITRRKAGKKHLLAHKSPCSQKIDCPQWLKFLQHI
ncbi:MAG: 50S ribosomal protein L35 [Candidatus Melainabacteria bacterium]|nr:MAG: 50S ribosomal protein L35 [Candidatus Melainabacteria bacterium]